MKRTIFLMLATLVWVCNMYAKPVSEVDAKIVAYNFMKNKLDLRSVNDLNLVYTKSNSQTTLYRVFSNTKGFVIVSGDDRCEPIIGYSTEVSFLVPEKNDTITGNNFWGRMESYEKQIEYVVDKDLPAGSKIESKWQNLKLKNTQIQKNNLNLNIEQTPIKWKDASFWEKIKFWKWIKIFKSDKTSTQVQNPNQTLNYFFGGGNSLSSTENASPNLNLYASLDNSFIPVTRRTNLDVNPNQFLNSLPYPPLVPSSVSPLLTTTWGQGWPYSALCPSGTVVGCVGVAMGQIMKYHNYPSQGLGSYGYTYGSNPYTGANFGATSYNFSSMANSISTMTSSADTAVARLLYHAGVSCRSMWGSSTGVGYSSDEDPMTRAWVNYFKYAYSTISYVKKSDYTSTAWDTLIQTELDASRPVYYRGDGSLSHAWVCDGYDSSGLYHFNWGWDGSYNGYFSLSNLNPGGNTLTSNQHAIIGIKPNDGSTLVSNTTWSGTVTKSTHIAVPDAITLTVDSTATVKFAENCKLQVFGRLLSTGTSTSYAKFTAVDTSDGWLGIKWDNYYNAMEVMADNDTSKLIYTQVEYSKASGIYCYAYGKVVVDHCKINNNYSGTGAGLSIWLHPININYSEIYNNHATIQGGGFFLTSTNTLSANICHNNIHDNLSDIDGGGFCLSATYNILFAENIVHDNQAIKGAGGALFSGSPTIINNKFCNNTASSSGGGLYMENCNAKIVNNLIANNSSNGAGGALVIGTNSNSILINNTLVNNYAINAGGGANVAVNSNPTFKNCILFGNLTSGPGNQIVIGTTNSDPFFDHCDIQGGLNGFGGPGSGTNYTSGNYTNNIDSNPVFVNPTSGAGTGYNGLTANWQLQSSSPCVNAGDTVGVSTLIPALDLANHPRLNGIIDMGAYEYGAGATITSSPANQSVCVGDTATFVVVASGGSTINYQWYKGSNLLTGSTNDSLVIDSVVTGNAGNYYCIASNAYGSDTSNIAVLTVNTVPDTVNINGSSTVCKMDTVSYWLDSISNATSYGWTFPSGFTIISGSGTDSVVVSIGSSATNGNIIAYAINSCGSGVSDTFAVTVNTVPDTANINGSSTVCKFDTLIYYLDSLTNTSNYTWSFPSGFTLISTGGNDTVSVYIDSNAISGYIVAYASNSCGNGVADSLYIVVNNVPAQPSAIVGDTNPCLGDSQVYSVTNVTSVSYTWSVPSFWTIVSGQGSDSISVTVGSSPGNISVVPSNVCGNGTSQSLAVTVNTVPAQPSTITGNTNPCLGDSQVYSITNVSGVSYTWSVPSSWTLVSGQGSNSITVTVGSSPGNISVTPSNVCGNGSYQSLAVTVNTVPAQPSTITGNPNPCLGDSQVYSVTNVSGVSYAWSVPGSWTIISGQGSDSITVTVGSSPGNISVTPSNVCGNGTSRTLAVTVNTVPAQPSAIVGDTNPCLGSNQVYSITNVSGVSYAWSIPSSWTLVSGQGSDSITVTVGSSPGNISVTPSNVCGNGTSRTLAVTVNTVPAQPSAIVGDTNPCLGSNQVYSITNVSGVSYAWSIPSSWTLVSGQGSDSITVTVGSSPGNISVTPSNVCGNGTSRTLAVTVNTVPAQPSAIVGDTNPCLGSNQVYSITNVSGVSYAWSIPSSWTLVSGQGSNSITVTVGSSPGNIQVVPSNVCGNGTSQSLAVTVNTVPAQPSTITGNTNPCLGDSQVYSITNVSGVSYAWSVPGSWTLVSGQGNDSITVTVGSSPGNISVVPSNICGNGSSQTLAVTVNTVPAIPNQPSGADTVDLNTTTNSIYTTNSVTNTDYYLWELIPLNAGSLSSGNDTLVTVTWDTGYAGNCSLSVKAVNICGSSQYSVPKNIYVDYITSVNEVEKINVSIFPNPCDGRFTIISNKQISSVYLYDVCGRVVNPPISFYQGSLVTVDCSSLSEGMYFVHVCMDEKSMVRRVIVR